MYLIIDLLYFFFFKQKTAYEIYQCDWSSDVCSSDLDATLNDWKVVDSLIPDNFISVCLDRNYLSNQHLISRIKSLKEVTRDRLVIQADGIPMSGGSDDFNTTLQAIAIADIIRKNKIPAFILASGGTNSKTRELADLCGVRVNGVAIGTHARKIVADLIKAEDFEENMELIKKATDIAQELINLNVG